MNILILLVITILAYGAFPFLFAKTRTTSITKKKYRWLCFGINFVIMLCFVAMNGGATSGAAYLLWTWLFSRYGIKVLGLKGLMTDSEYLEEDPNRLTECKSCGYRDKNFFNACPRCGKYAKQYVYLNEAPPVETDKIHVCHKCGEKLVENSRFCCKCGAEITDDQTEE